MARSSRAVIGHERDPYSPRPGILRQAAVFGATLFAATGMLMTGAGWWIHSVLAFLGRRSVVTDARDFTAFYPAAHLMAHGGVRRLYDSAAFEAVAHSYGVLALPADRTLPYLNPPFFALLLAPLGTLPFDSAFQAWAIVNLGALVGVCAIVWWAAREESLAMRAGLMLVVITARPVPFSLQLGQFSLLLLAIWTGAFLALKAGRGTTAGLFLAACLIKPEIVIPVCAVLAWHRRWDVLRPFALAAGALALISMIMVGPRGTVAYPALVYDEAIQHADGTQTELMMGWNAVFEGVFRHTNHNIETLAAIPVSLLTLGALMWSCRRSFGGGDDVTFAARWLLITIVTMLVDPHFYLQDAVLLTVPACYFLLASRGRLRDTAWLVALGGWWALSRGFQPNLDWGVALVPLYMAAVAVALMVWMERRERASAEAEDRNLELEPLAA